MQNSEQQNDQDYILHFRLSRVGNVGQANGHVEINELICSSFDPVVATYLIHNPINEMLGSTVSTNELKAIIQYLAQRLNLLEDDNHG